MKEKKPTKVSRQYKRKFTRKSSNWNKSPYGTTAGYPVNTSLSKRKVFVRQETIDTRTLYRFGITDIDQTANNLIDQRQRQIVDCVGFDLHYQVLQNIGQFPTYFNIAVVSINAQTATGTPIEQDFFRGLNQNRGQDFATTLTALDFHSLPINADDYKVLAHKRHTIAPAVGGGLEAGSNPGYFSSNVWIPFKRQLRYTRATTNRPTADACFLVYWCDRFNGVATNPPLTDVIQMQWKVITYFKEPM